MKLLILGCILSLFSMNLIGQSLDLIVTSDNDSIACRIDSVTSKAIYFQAKIKENIIRTYLNLKSVASYKMDFIENENAKPIPGTIYFRSQFLEEFNPRKNTIYATGGILGLNASYERLIAKTSRGVFNSFWFRIGGGIFAVPTEMGGPLAVTSVHTLSGKRKHHLEMNLGAFTFYDITNESWKLLPAAGMGYRYQNPEGGLLFRGGLSLPEYAYISVGYSFR